MSSGVLTKLSGAPILRRFVVPDVIITNLAHSLISLTILLIVETDDGETTGAVTKQRDGEMPSRTTLPYPTKLGSGDTAEGQLVFDVEWPFAGEPGEASYRIEVDDQLNPQRPTIIVPLPGRYPPREFPSSVLTDIFDVPTDFIPAKHGYAPRGRIARYVVIPEVVLTNNSGQTVSIDASHGIRLQDDVYTSNKIVNCPLEEWEDYNKKHSVITAPQLIFPVSIEDGKAVSGFVIAAIEEGFSAGVPTFAEQCLEFIYLRNKAVRRVPLVKYFVPTMTEKGGGAECVATSRPVSIDVEMAGEFLVAVVKNSGPQVALWAELTVQDPSDGILDRVGVPRHRLDKTLLVWQHDPTKTRYDIPAGGDGALRIAKLLVWAEDSTAQDADRQTTKVSATWEAEFANSHKRFNPWTFHDDTLIHVALLSDPPLQQPCQVQLQLCEDGTVENKSSGESFRVDLSSYAAFDRDA